MSPYAANAAAVTYTPKDVKGGSVEGSVPVNKVGDLMLTDASAIIKGNVIDVESKDTSGVKKTVLSGVVFKTKVTGTGATAKLTGLAYFRQGTSLGEIDDPEAEELIDIEDGGVVGGKIVAVNRDELVMSTPAGERRVPVDKLKRVCSPKVYSFSMPLVAGAKIDLNQQFQADAKQIKFERTAAPCTSKQKKAAEAQGRHPKLCCHGFLVAVVPPKEAPAVGKIIAITAVMAAVAAAIAIPIAVAVPLGNKKKPPPPVFLPPPPKQQPPPPPPPPPRGT
jgi:hypothetical protein